MRISNNLRDVIKYVSLLLAVYLITNAYVVTHSGSSVGFGPPSRIQDHTLQAAATYDSASPGDDRSSGSASPQHPQESSRTVQKPVAKRPVAPREDVKPRSQTPLARKKGHVVTEEELLPFDDAINVAPHEILPTYHIIFDKIYNKKAADRVAMQRRLYDMKARHAVKRGAKFVFFPEEAVASLADADRERCLKRHFAEVRFRRGLVPLFFRHMQKASGTSICELCSKQGLGWEWREDVGYFGDNCNPLFKDALKTVLSTDGPEVIKKNMREMLVKKRTSIVALEYMTPRDFPTDYFPGITSMRDPFKQIISRWHRFTKFKQTLVNFPATIEFYQGITINRLSGCLTAGNMPCPRAYDERGRVDLKNKYFYMKWHWPPNRVNVSSEAMLEYAAHYLNEWSAVLVLERLKEGFPLLEWGLGFTNVSGTYPHRNSAKREYKSPTSWPDWNDPDWKKVTSTQWHDEYRLLDVAYRLLDVRAPAAQKAMDEGRFHFNNVMCHPYVHPRALPESFPRVWKN